MSMIESTDSEPGLRERKRAATRIAIEHIAIDMALERGYDRTTVEAICSAGMVSHRTFFNYFGSKEGAFLGAAQPTPDDQAVAAFVHAGGENIVSDLIEIISATLLEGETDHDLFLKRRNLIQTTPELTDAVMIRMRDSEGMFVALILRRFAAEAGAADVGEVADREPEARMVMALALGVVHFIMREWLESGFELPTQDLRANAIALVQRVLAPRPDRKHESRR